MGKMNFKPSRAMTGFFPLPIVLITCIGKDNKPNIVTVGMATSVCSEPPQIGIALRPTRYSHKLISKTKEFVVNIPTQNLLKETDYCGIVSGRFTNKFDEACLTQEKAFRVKAPLIRECPVNIECSLNQIIKLGSHDFFIGEVLSVDVSDEVIDHSQSDRVLDPKMKIDFNKVIPIVVNFYEYWNLGKKIGKVYKVVNIDRTKIAKDHKEAIDEVIGKNKK